jgi:hypothetical protein
MGETVRICSQSMRPLYFVALARFQGAEPADEPSDEAGGLALAAGPARGSLRLDETILARMQGDVSAERRRRRPNGRRGRRNQPPLGCRAHSEPRSNAAAPAPASTSEVGRGNLHRVDLAPRPPPASRRQKAAARARQREGRSFRWRCAPQG